MTKDEITTAKNSKREYQRTYMKQWRKANPDKVRETNLRYWLRRAEREAAEREREKASEVNQYERANS